MSRTVARERAPNKTKTNFMACVTGRRMANWDWRGRIELRLPTFVYSSPCCWPPPPNNVKGFEAPDKHAQSPSFSWVQVGRSVTDRVLDWISSIRNILSKHHFHSVPAIWNGTATYNTTLVVRNGVQVEFASHWSATKRRELIGGLVADEMCCPHSIQRFHYLILLGWNRRWAREGIFCWIYRGTPRVAKNFGAVFCLIWGSERQLHNIILPSYYTLDPSAI